MENSATIMTRVNVEEQFVENIVFIFEFTFPLQGIHNADFVELKLNQS